MSVCPMRWLSLPVRLALGGLMAFSGWMKLGLHTELGLQGVLPLKSLTPQDFVFAIKGFQLGLPEPVMVLLAFVIAWLELLAGLMLIAGWKARSAGLVVVVLMAGFAAGIASLMVRGLDVNCPCFGAIKLFCTGPMGACHLVRNTGFALAGVWVVVFGAGPWAVDAWRRGEGACGKGGDAVRG
jgi:putative oxidoreductase